MSNESLHEVLLWFLKFLKQLMEREDLVRREEGDLRTLPFLIRSRSSLLRYLSLASLGLFKTGSEVAPSSWLPWHGLVGY
jgi:hypothetical protein